MATNDTKDNAELLKAFSHPTRFAILKELVAGPKCVNDMEEILPARQANISQHLSVLRHAKLVDFAQDGILRCYYLCRPKLVTDLMKLLDREERLVTRSSESIKADKKRLAKMVNSENRSKSKSAINSISTARRKK